MPIHVSEKNIVMKTKGGLLLGDATGLLEDADLATTLAAAKTAVDADADNPHVSTKVKLRTIVKASLDLIGNYDSTYIGGSDANKATMLALIAGSTGAQARF